MSLSFFSEKSHPPSDDEVRSCLGASAPLWRQVHDAVRARVPGIEAEWGYGGARTGWGLRLRDGRRVILYLTPCEGHFLASTAIGEKAAGSEAARGMPATLRRLLDAAPRYAEGRGVRIPVRKAADVRDVGHLVVLKLAR